MQYKWGVREKENQTIQMCELQKRRIRRYKWGIIGNENQTVQMAS